MTDHPPASFSAQDALVACMVGVSASDRAAGMSSGLMA